MPSLSPSPDRPVGRPAATVGRRNGDPTCGPSRHVYVGSNRQGHSVRPVPGTARSHITGGRRSARRPGSAAESSTVRRLDPVLKRSTTSAFQRSTAYPSCCSNLFWTRVQTCSQHPTPDTRSWWSRLPPEKPACHAHTQH